MEEKKPQLKKMFSVYIDEELINKIRNEAQIQNRKISAQTEVYLREILNK